GQGAAVDTLGEALGRGAAVADVVFHPEVGLDAPRVVAGTQNQTAEGAVGGNHRWNCWGRHENAGTHQHAPKIVGRGEAHQALDGGAVVVAPVTSYDQGLTSEVDLRLLTHRIKDRLHEVLQVVRLHENARFLA